MPAVTLANEITSPVAPTSVLASLVKRRLVVGVGVLLCAVLAVATVFTSLTRVAPVWWENSDPDDARVVRNAEEVEGAMLAQLTLVRGKAGGGPAAASDWSVSMTRRDACDWLSVRLPMWVESQGNATLPKDVEGVRVAFSDEGVYMGAMVRQDGRRCVVWALVQPRIDENGSLWLPASRVGVGLTPMPMETALARLRGTNADGEPVLPARVREREEFKELVAVLAGEKPALMNATVRVDRARKVRLTSLGTGEGRLIVTAKTELE